MTIENFSFLFSISRLSDERSFGISSGYLQNGWDHLEARPYHRTSVTFLTSQMQAGSSTESQISSQVTKDVRRARMSAYKPKIYRSQEGCCICKAKSSRFIDNDIAMMMMMISGNGWKQILVGVQCGECTQQTDYVPAPHYLQIISSSTSSSSKFLFQFPVHGQREVRGWLHRVLQAFRE